MRTLHALKRMTGVTLVVAMLFVTVGSSGGCFRQQFDVGTGGTGAERQEFRQWFAFWGLLPITEVQADVEAYAGDSQNYTVSSEFTPIDFLFGLLTGIVTIYPKTMAVEK